MRTRKVGATRKLDSRRFWGYKKVKGKIYEVWLSPESFAKSVSLRNRLSLAAYHKNKTKNENGVHK